MECWPERQHGARIYSQRDEFPTAKPEESSEFRGKGARVEWHGHGCTHRAGALRPDRPADPDLELFFESASPSEIQERLDCVIGPPLCEPLIGQLVLQQLDLVVDCARRTLTPRPESPNLPLLKLK